MVVIKRLISDSQENFYMRLFTPLVLLWCFIYQRLNEDHTCDAVVSHLTNGTADYLENSHPIPLSQRIKSFNTAAYCKGRQRLPLSVLQGSVAHTAQVIRKWLGNTNYWLGHRVALLDGTTLLVRPTPELLSHYGQHQNQHGNTYWVVIRVVASFCLHSGALLGIVEGSLKNSEQFLAAKLFAQSIKNTVYVGDRNFGVFSVIQAARHYGIYILIRLTQSRASSIAKNKISPQSDIRVTWTPSAYDQLYPDMSPLPSEGRLIYLKIERAGFRPIELFFFTTLLDANIYTVEELVKLYGLRWHVELNLRYVKDTLALGLLTSKSVEMVRKELFAGILTYNIVRGFMVKSSQQANLSPLQLSFTSCWRHIRITLLTLLITDSKKYISQVIQKLLIRLSRCKLPQRQRFRIEPRVVRRPPSVYPNLKGSRIEARQLLLKTMEVTIKS